MLKNGESQRLLTNNKFWNQHPNFSPNGKHFIFAMTNHMDIYKMMSYDIDDENWEIYSMNLDGSQQLNLTNHPSNDREPDINPSAIFQ